MVLKVAVPVVQRRAADSHPHKGAHHVHDRVGQFAAQRGQMQLVYQPAAGWGVVKGLCLPASLPLVLGRAEAERNQLHGRVDEEADEHARRHDFHVRVLLLVQVPGAAGAEEITAIAGTVQDDDNQVDHLHGAFDWRHNNNKKTRIIICQWRLRTPLKNKRTKHKNTRERPIADVKARIYPTLAIGHANNT